MALLLILALLATALWLTGDFKVMVDGEEWTGAAGVWLAAGAVLAAIILVVLALAGASLLLILVAGLVLALMALLTAPLLLPLVLILGLVVWLLRRSKRGPGGTKTPR